jgi:GTP-binding protein HflX
VDDHEHEASLIELAQLAKTLGLTVVGRIQQKRSALAPGVVVGSGKLAELAALTGGSGKVPKGPPEKRRQAGRGGDSERERGGDSERERGGHSEVDQDLESELELEPDATTGGDELDPGDPDRPGKRAAQATVVLVDHDLTPTQLRNLEGATGAEVLDRTAVILAIFERHARSREARLQVEIARLAYMAPRLRVAGHGSDRSGGGLGAKGAGESAAQLERRKVRDRIAELKSELGDIARNAGRRRERRAAADTVALVGYTNAGKSSLMRGLTGGEVYVADKLFATLDTTVRALVPPAVPPVLVSDTVGFLKKLPHDLVASFRSTLDEAREADLLLHVVDASNPALASQIQVTRQVLGEIGAGSAPELLLLNKIDRVPAARRAELARDYPAAIQLSAKAPADVAALRETLIEFFARDLVEGDLLIPFALQRLVSEAHASCRVLAETYDERGARLRVLARPAVLTRLQAEVAG